MTSLRTPNGATTPRKHFALLQSPLEPHELPPQPMGPLLEPTLTGSIVPSAHEQATSSTTPDAAAGTTSKIHFLDGLRGLAAMTVVVQHAHWMEDLHVGQPAVDLFFVLSAFLLTMLFEKKARGLLAERAGWRRWAWALLDYFVRRFLRVYPLFAATTLVVWKLPDAEKQRYFVFHHPEQFNVLKTLVFAFDSRYHVFWTLPLEIMYYFLIPVFVLAALRLQKFWVLPMVLLVGIVAYAGCTWVRDNHQPLRPHLPTFLCGSIAAIVYAKINQLMNARRWVFQWKSRLLLRTIEILCLAVLLSTLVDGLLFSWVFPHAMPQRFVAGNLAAIIVCELLLPGAVSSVLEWSLLRYAGKISYSMYLLHSFVVYSPWVERQTYYDRYIAIWALTFLLSTVSYHAIEFPCQRLAGLLGRGIKARDVVEKKRELEAKTATEYASPV
jgi:peptidoglycan/LPS O-acetylase OafA/YrhL